MQKEAAPFLSYGGYMTSSINITAVFVSDAVGISILLILLLTRGWDMPTKKKESNLLFIMMLASLVNCVADALTSYFDGQPGSAFRTVLMVGNTYLYLFNLIVGFGIIYLVVNHIGSKVPKFQNYFFNVVAIVNFVLLIANFFYPLVFSLDEYNRYSRESFYIIFIISGFLLILYGYAFYFIARIKSPSLSYFPAWQFLMPILISTLIQMNAYGISLQPVSFAVSFAGLVTCLQNECIYLDKLTGVNNRYELDHIRKLFMHRKNEKMAALMLDLNGFKQINDEFSHEEGDNALIAFANILVNTIGTEGRVIRFAGDEFVILMRQFKGDSVAPYIERINKAIDDYNSTSGKSYKLSSSIGGTVFDYHGQELSSILSTIDQMMYEDKKNYYQEHREHDRRHGR